VFLKIFFKITFIFFIKRVLPWLVAAGVVYWLLHHYSMAALLAAAELANPITLFALALGYFLYVWTLDTFGVAALLSRFGPRIRGRELLGLRAATYPMSLVNYGAGQASFGFFIQRRWQMPVGDILGVFGLITVMDLFWAITLAFVGSFIGEHRIMGVDLTPTVRSIGLITYVLATTHLVFWSMHWEYRVRGPFWTRFFAWLREKQLFRIFHEATLADYFRLALWRLPIHLMLIGAFYLVAQCFQSHIDLSALLGNAPIAVLIGVIPISWGGVGTSNKALVDLLAPHTQILSAAAGHITPEELILAMSLLWMFLNYLLKLGFGMVYLTRQRTLKNCQPS